MFRIVSIIAFLVIFLGIALHHIAFPSVSGEHRWRPVNILKKLLSLLKLLFLKQKLSPLGVLKKLVYLLALLCFVVLAVTGFYPALVLDRDLSGYLLMLHVTAGGVFAGCLAVLALSWAHHYRFNENDWPWLQKLLKREAVNKAAGEKCEFGQKIAFWLIVLSALAVFLSMVLSMFALFGTAGQRFLESAHRYSALLLALAAIVHSYLIILTQVEQ